MKHYLLTSFHGTAGPIPFAPSAKVPLTEDQAAKAKEFIDTLDAFDMTPGDGQFETKASGAIKVPLIGSVKFDGVQVWQVVTEPA